MRKIGQISLILVLLFSISGISIGQNAKKNSGAKEKKKSTPVDKTNISYEDYLTEITGKLPEIKKNRVTLERSKNKIYGASSVDDVSLTSDFNYSGTNQYLYNDNNGITSGYNYSAALNKTFSATGTRLSGGFSYSNSKYKDGITTPDYTTNRPAVTVGISQPILYNFMGKIDSYNFKDAKMQHEIDKIRDDYNNTNVLNYYKKLYFDWVQYREILIILKDSIKKSNIQKNQTQRKVKVGLADNDDLQKSISSVLQYKARYEEYKISLRNIEKELAIYFKDRALTPDRAAFKELYEKSSKDKYLMESFEDTLSGKIYALTKSNLLYKKDVYNNKLLPELNVYANATRTTADEDAATSISSMNDTDYAVGLEFKYTLGNSANKSDLKDVELQLKELNLEKKGALDEYTKNINTINEYINGYKSLIKVGNSTVKSLKSQLATEKKKYRQARLNLSYVIDTENNIATKKIEILQYKNQVIKFYLDYKDIIK